MTKEEFVNLSVTVLLLLPLLYLAASIKPAAHIETSKIHLPALDAVSH